MSNANISFDVLIDNMNKGVKGLTETSKAMKDNTNTLNEAAENLNSTIGKFEQNINNSISNNIDNLKSVVEHLEKAGQIKLLDNVVDLNISDQGFEKINTSTMELDQKLQEIISNRADSISNISKNIDIESINIDGLDELRSVSKEFFDIETKSFTILNNMKSTVELMQDVLKVSLNDLQNVGDELFNQSSKQIDELGNVISGLTKKNSEVAAEISKNQAKISKLQKTEKQESKKDTKKEKKDPLWERRIDGLDEKELAGLFNNIYAKYSSDLDKYISGSKKVNYGNLDNMIKKTADTGESGEKINKIISRLEELDSDMVSKSQIDQLISVFKQVKDIESGKVDPLSLRQPEQDEGVKKPTVSITKEQLDDILKNAVPDEKVFTTISQNIADKLGSFIKNDKNFDKINPDVERINKLEADQITAQLEKIAAENKAMMDKILVDIVSGEGKDKFIKKETDISNQMIEKLANMNDNMVSKSSQYYETILSQLKVATDDIQRIIKEYLDHQKKQMSPVNEEGKVMGFQEYKVNKLKGSVDKKLLKPEDLISMDGVAGGAVSAATKFMTPFKSAILKGISSLANILKRVIYTALNTAVGLISNFGKKVVNLLNPFAKKEKSILGRILGIGGMGYLINKALSGIRGFVRDSLQIASDMEETQNVVNTVFEGTEERIKRFSETSMKYLGLSSLQTEQFASTYKSMLSSVEGIDQEFSTHMAQMMTGLAADVGSFYSATMDTKQAFETLKAPLDRQSLKIAKLGVNMTQSAMADWAGDQGFDYMKADMQSQTLLRLAYVFEKLQMTAGDFYRNQMSFHNQLELIKNKLLEIKGIFGAMFVDIIKPVLNYVNAFLDLILNKADILVNLFYKMIGKQRPSKEEGDKNRKPVPAPLDEGMLSAMDSEKMAMPEDKEEPKKKGKELDLLGMDNVELLKTDYSDPEKEKDRKQNREQFNAILGLLDKNMQSRENAVEKIKEQMAGELDKAGQRAIERMKEVYVRIEPIIDRIASLLEAFIGFVMDVFPPIKNGVMSGFQRYNTQGVIDNIFDNIKNTLNNVSAILGQPTMETEDGKVMKNAGNTLGEIIALIITIRLKVLEYLTLLFATFTEMLKDTGLGVKLLEGIQTALEKIAEIMENIVNFIVDKIVRYGEVEKQTQEDLTPGTPGNKYVEAKTDSKQKNKDLTKKLGFDLFSNTFARGFTNPTTIPVRLAQDLFKNRKPLKNSMSASKNARDIKNSILGPITNKQDKKDRKKALNKAVSRNMKDNKGVGGGGNLPLLKFIPNPKGADNRPMKIHNPIYLNGKKIYDDVVDFSNKDKRMTGRPATQF